MLIYLDSYGYLRGLGVRIDTGIGILLTDGTKARAVSKNDVFTLSSIGEGFYIDSYGRRFYETESSYTGNGAGNTSVSTWGDKVVRVGNCELNYIGELVVKVGGTELHYYGDKLCRKGFYLSLHYRGDWLVQIGDDYLSYTGERVTKIGNKYL